MSTQAFIEMLFLNGDRATADPLVPTILNAVLT
jgi:hypothetical protein